MSIRKHAAWSVAIGILVAATAGMASASETGTATIGATPLGGGVFQYNLALTNTSTDGSTIGTFWFSWIPGVDYMEAKPTNITAPAGWISPITGANNSFDGNAIENYDIGGTGDLLQPGHTFNFSFDSTEPFSQILGNSTIGGHLPETTAFIYSGFPEADLGLQINATAVPEPVSASMLALCGGGLLMRRRRA
jgi:hypothetical protein